MIPNPRPDSSMTLLTEMFEHPLDPGYAAAANRRRKEGKPPATRTSTVVVLIAAFLIGLLFVMAAKVLRPAPTDAARAKEQLIDRIDQQRTTIQDRTARIAALDAEVTTLQDNALRETSDDLTSRLENLEVLAGGVDIEGQGLVMKLDDAANTQAGSGLDPRGASGFPTGRVTSTDLQVVVNGLWAAGAEAISINGQRLTSRSAIRFAGQAVLVDYHALSAPYAINVIGDGAAIVDAFDNSAAGNYAARLTKEYKIPVVAKTSDSVKVPKALSMDVQVARPLTTAGPTPSDPVRKTP